MSFMIRSKVLHDFSAICDGLIWTLKGSKGSNGFRAKSWGSDCQKTGLIIGSETDQSPSQWDVQGRWRDGIVEPFLGIGTNEPSKSGDAPGISPIFRWPMRSAAGQVKRLQPKFEYSFVIPSSQRTLIPTVTENRVPQAPESHHSSSFSSFHGSFIGIIGCASHLVNGL